MLTKRVIWVIAISSQLSGGGITEYLYQTTPLHLNDDTIVINNTEVDKEIFIHNQLPSVVVNNLVHRNTETFKSFSSWDVGEWTNLHNATSQWGLTGLYDSTVSYGETALQTKSTQTGIFLNTYGKELVTSNTGTSIQYVVGWTGDENIGANLWNTRPSDDLCVSAKLEIAYSSVSDHNQDGIEAVNQVLITYLFRVKSINKSFFYNIALYDSRSDNIFNEFLMPYDGQDTSLPIVITLAPSDGLSTRYAHAPNHLTQSLQPFTHGIKPQDTKLYASCISYQEMQNIINDIKHSRPDFNVSDFRPENIRLDTVIIGPEINTKPSGDNREDGNLGMRLDDFNVYRYSDIEPSTNFTFINNTKVENITSYSARVTWSLTNTSINKIEIYQNEILIDVLSPDTTSYVIDDLLPGTKYTFKIIVYDDNGQKDIKTISFSTKDDYTWLISIYHLILQ